MPSTRTLLIILAAIITLTASAQRRNSTSPRLKPADHQVHQTMLFDTIAVKKGMLTFAGYDKKMRANKETVFVTNNTSCDIFRLIFRVEYFDMQGRQLHSQRVQLNTDLSAGQTRCLNFPSWDRQGSFYFHQSQRPRVSAAPYDVRIHPDTIFTITSLLK